MNTDGGTPTEIHGITVAEYRGACLRKLHAKDWCTQLCSGRITLQDNPGPVQELTTFMPNSFQHIDLLSERIAE